ncbi:MAG: hypothetical protein IJU80_14455 [Lachnospiraceae bacterium]|jgi:hypothetical protein|nr:hypothetical protein [Lachnospiraceae bacterium]
MVNAAEIRKKLRISTDSLDEDIRDNIDAARLDMSRVGISEAVDDKLTDKAVELYCKWQFNYMDKADQFERNYRELRNAMSITEKYRRGEEDV